MNHHPALFRFGISAVFRKLSSKPTMYRRQHMHIQGLKDDFRAVRKIRVCDPDTLSSVLKFRKPRHGRTVQVRRVGVVSPLEPTRFFAKVLPDQRDLAGVGALFHDDALNSA